MRIIKVLNDRITEVKFPKENYELLESEQISENGNLNQILVNGVWVDDVDLIKLEQREIAKQEVYSELQKAINLNDTSLIETLRTEYINLCDGAPVKCISTLENELTKAQLSEEEYLNIIMEDGGVW